MADTSNLTNFLTDVANAIRTKKETEAEIPAEQFDSEILSIETGGVGDVKLFETEETMQADENAKEGDKAIVYGSSIQNGTATTEFTQISFLDTVVLPSAVTSSSYCMMRSDTGMGDGQIQLSASRFRFDYYGADDMVRVSYSSTDGITYTKTEGDSIITFEEPIKCYHEEEWDDNMGYFMQTGSYNFGGLFEYKLNVDTNAIQLYDLSTATISYSNSGSTTESLVFNSKLPDVYSVEKLNSIEHIRNSATLYLSTDNKLKLVCSNVTYDRILVNNSNEIIGLCSLGSTSEDVIIYDLDYATLKLSNPINIKSVSFNSNSSQYVALSNIKSIPLRLNNTYHSYSLGMCQLNQTMWNWSKTSDLHIYNDMYVFAPTQLTLKSSNELLPGKIAYGKNGVVTGSDDIYNNLDTSKILSNIYNLLLLTVNGVGSAQIFGEIDSKCAIMSNYDLPIARTTYLKKSESDNFDLLVCNGNANKLSVNANDLTTYINASKTVRIYVNGEHAIIHSLADNSLIRDITIQKRKIWYSI